MRVVVDEGYSPDWLTLHELPRSTELDDLTDERTMRLSLEEARELHRLLGEALQRHGEEP